ncbi:metallophosphoesterase family protein [Saccharicrinis aurantiacus]|uniref:metallophosphoesterase family protein n=1 Tax=Saccharicrinis aurantiacus TaxID=1849719 RepID=UPI0009500D62|nr:metallophosphoesterase [Saccharicrinis aurantiacus]
MKSNFKSRKKAFVVISTLIVVFTFLSCQHTVFTNDISTSKKPWTHLNFNSHDSKFSFAIFADLTGGERPEIFKVAVAQLNLLQPDLIVNVGDLIEGANSDTSVWHQQWDNFDKRANRAIAPIFYAGGNHDLTGQIARDVWSNRYGPHYYHFRYKDVLFLIFNTEDYSSQRMHEINEIRKEGAEIFEKEGVEAFKKSAYAHLPERVTGNIGDEQVRYFKKVLANNTDARHTFIMIHKPVWQKENEQQFSQIESALHQMPYTVFYGHTHMYNYEERNGQDYINLSTTGGFQFSEPGKSFDHIMWVTVNKSEVSLANIKLGGILDKTGRIPLGSDTLKFE